MKVQFTFKLFTQSTRGRPRPRPPSRPLKETRQLWGVGGGSRVSVTSVTRGDVQGVEGCLCDTLGTEVPDSSA